MIPDTGRNWLRYPVFVYSRMQRAWWSKCGRCSSRAIVLSPVGSRRGIDQRKFVGGSDGHSLATAFTLMGGRSGSEFVVGPGGHNLAATGGIDREPGWQAPPGCRAIPLPQFIRASAREPS